MNKTIKTSFEDFDLDKLSIYNELTPQSEEIRFAVEEDEDQGAGDQGWWDEPKYCRIATQSSHSSYSSYSSSQRRNPVQVPFYNTQSSHSLTNGEWLFS